MSNQVIIEIADLRVRFAGDRYVNQSRWMNGLLDLHRAADLASVKAEIEAALRRCGQRTLFDVADIEADLTAIETAAQVEAAFEHLVIAA